MKLKVASSASLSKLESQLSGFFMFLEFTKNIHEVQTAGVLLKLQEKHNELSQKLNGMKNRTGLYLQEVS